MIVIMTAISVFSYNADYVCFFQLLMQHQMLWQVPKCFHQTFQLQSFWQVCLKFHQIFQKVLRLWQDHNFFHQTYQLKDFWQGFHQTFRLQSFWQVYKKIHQTFHWDKTFPGALPPVQVSMLNFLVIDPKSK